MSRVAEILARKGGQVHVISPGATAFEALVKMVKNGVGSLVVVDGDDIVGIITERDYLRRVALQQRDAGATPVREIMTGNPICLGPDRPVEDCMAIMTRERIRHLPVIEGGRLAGLVSIGDTVKHLSAEREVEVRHLTDFITGKYPA
ncbi:MAG: CBS domain-containing protein [Candidatus Eisenbacteria bacterium]|nr:CBS domain-containing protein [Candidatus Eisenbacteria bacterium]